MTRKEYRQAIEQVIELAGCAVNGKIPNKDTLSSVNLTFLYQAAEKHMLTAIVGYALTLAGLHDHAFQQAYAKSVRKVTVMTIEMEQLFRRMEQEKIWYLPLKGAVIKDLYPSVGLRQMSDVDVLFDKTKAEQVRDIMLSMGYHCEHFGRFHHDVYHKPPVSNFELHTDLFNATNKTEVYQYYQEVTSRLLKDTDNGYGYHFSNNDLYLHVIAHEYKHYRGGGTGLRSLLDTYIIWQKLNGQLDEAYIQAETTKMGIYDFEQKNRQLALHLFHGDSLTQTEQEMLDYIIFSGTYGTEQNNIANRVKENGGGKKGKRLFLLKRLFLPMNVVKVMYPTVYRHKILLPFLPFYRVIKAFTVNRKKTKAKLKILKNL